MMEPKIEKTQEIWIVQNNSDRNAGSGYNYTQHACKLQATAIRLATRAGIQGADAQVIKSAAYRIDGIWYAPRSLTSGTQDDINAEKLLKEQEVKRLERQAILEKVRELGLSEEELELLRQ